MIIQSLCNSCLQPFTIIVQADEARLVRGIVDPDGFTAPCPRKCGGKINIIGDPVIEEMAKDRRLRDPMTITGLELYQACFGMGLPDEIPKSAETVTALLLAHRIKSVDIESDANRFYLHEIRLDNGTIVHLSAGSKGAQILKITREASP